MQTIKSKNVFLVIVHLLCTNSPSHAQNNMEPFENLANPVPGASVSNELTQNTGAANIQANNLQGSSDDEFSGANDNYTLDNFSTAVEGEDDGLDDTGIEGSDLFLPEGSNTSFNGDNIPVANEKNIENSSSQSLGNSQPKPSTNDARLEPAEGVSDSQILETPEVPSTSPANVNSPIEMGGPTPELVGNSPSEGNLGPSPSGAASESASPLILNPSPLLPGSIKELSEAEAPEEYIIESGDTLYDICDQLLKDAAYWPKLWALNPHIKNPHILEPGTKIKFFTVTESAPHLEILPQEDIPIADENFEQIILGEVIPPIHVAPKTAGILTGEELDALADFSAHLLTAGKVYKSNDLLTRVPAFIFEDEKDPLGYIYLGTEGNTLLNFGEKAVVDLEENVEVGTVYTVLREDPTYEGDGYLYYNAGSIKISQIIRDEDIAIGEISETVTGIYSNDILVPYISSVRVINNISQIGSISETDGEIMAFEKMSQELGADGNFVVINRGAKSGIVADQYYVIRQRVGYWSMGRSIDIDNYFENVGIVRIIDTTPTGSIGYVVKTTGEIRRGDLIGSKHM